MKTRRKVQISIIGLSLALSGAAASAQTTVTVGNTAPSAGAGVEYLGDSGTNVSGNVTFPFNVSDYIAGDNIASLGQTFTTGGHTGGYLLTSISFMQVANYSTWDSMNGLGSQGIRVFQMGNTISSGNPDGNGNPTYYQSVSSILDSESLTYPATTSGGNAFNSTPGTNAWWVTVSFGTPISLAANAQYGFDLQTDGTGGNGDFFMEWNGSTNSYSGGEAICDGSSGSAPDTSITSDQGAFLGNASTANNGGSRTFVATMTTVPEPTTFAMLGLGLAAALVRVRRRCSA